MSYENPHLDPLSPEYEEELKAIRKIRIDYLDRLRNHIYKEFPEISIDSINVIDYGLIHDTYKIEFKSPYIKIRKDLEITKLNKT